MDLKHIVTLELSGTQIKGAVATVGYNLDANRPSIPTVQAIITEDAAESIQYGRVQNLYTAGNLTKQVLDALRSLPILKNGTINGAYVSIAGRSLSSEQTSAEIVLPNEMVITAEILKSLFIEAAKKATQNKRVLKVLPRKYYVDNQTIQQPIGALGTRLRGDFTLVTCNPINQRNIDLVLSDKDYANLPVKEYVIPQLTLADEVLDEAEKQLGCILVDLGHQTTTMSIYKDRVLQYLVTLPMGSQNITRDIAMGMNVTTEMAEQAKCKSGDALATSNDARDDISRMNNYVAARAYEIAANINANIGYAKFKTTDLSAGFILVGRGSRLRNFDVLLSNMTKLPVRRAKLPGNINHAFNTAEVHPDDHMALISMIMRLSRDPKSESCVKFTAPEKKEVEEPKRVETQMSTKAPDVKVPTKQDVQRQVTDDNWADDDSDIEEEVQTTTQEPEKPVKPQKPAKEQKPKKGLLDNLKTKLVSLISADTMEDDADIN